MESIMCVDDVESLDPSLFQIPITSMAGIITGGVVDAHNRPIQTYAVVELGKQLLLAAKEGEVDTVRELMTKGAPFTTDWLGVSPLHLAVQNNHVSTAEVLLRAGISQEARTKVDRTPLHMAAQGGHLESVKLLLLHGAEVNCRDMLRMTPLHWAVEKQNMDVIETLVQGGADPYAVSKFEKSPMTIAQELGRADICHLLQTTNVSNIVSLSTPTHELDQDTLAATESIEAELGTVGQHNEVTQQIEAGSTSTKKGPRIRMQMDSKQVKITGPASSGGTVSSPAFKAQTPKRTTTSPSSGAALAAAEAELAAEAENADAVLTPGSASVPDTVDEDMPVDRTIQLLQAHGITMLPTDESTTVESAMESGQTVVLTEAGKMALNLTRFGGRVIGSPKPKQIATLTSGGVQKRSPILGSKSRIIKIHPSQLVALGGGRVQVPSQLFMQQNKGPNILKRVTLAPNASLAGIKNVPMNARVQRVVLTNPQQQQIGQQLLQQSPRQQEPQLLLEHESTEDQQQHLSVQQNSEEENMEPVGECSEVDEEEENEEPPMPTDFETIAQELAAARKQAAEFRKQLARKEREAERYLQQLRTIKGVSQ